jgi:hypothetical protein
MNFSYTEAAKKLSWKAFKAMHWDIVPMQGMAEPERELWLAEKWQEITGKNLKIDDKKEGAE